MTWRRGGDEPPRFFFAMNNSIFHYGGRIGTLLIVCLASGCWDEPSHPLDDRIGQDTVSGDGDDDGGDDTATDSVTATGEDTDTGSTGGDSETSTFEHQSNLPEGWSGFGAACVEHGDCVDYPGQRRCLKNVIGLINVPGGYCSSCCNEPGEDVCGPGIDCVGADGVYLICLSRCASDADCRQDGGFCECRSIYYIPDQFPGNYCLPKPEYSEPSPEDAQTDPDCPWPW